MRDHSIPRDTPTRRIALAATALLMAAALFAPAAARADRGRDAVRGRTGDQVRRLARVASGGHGRVALPPARASQRRRGERSGARDAWWRSAGPWPERRRFRWHEAPHERRFASHHAWRRRCAERDARFRSRAPRAWIRLTWGWPFPR